MAAEAGSTAKRVNSEELYNPLTVAGEEGEFDDVDGFGSALQPPSQPQAPPQGGKGRGGPGVEQDQRKSQLFCLALVILAAAIAGTVLLLAVLRSGGGGGDDDDASSSSSSLASGPPTFFLVETIPIVNFTLALAPGALNTYEVLTSMVNEAEKTLDISVMYWNLLAADDDDYDDNLEAACAEFGCERGENLYTAMINAVCERSVAIRFLQDNSTTSLSGLGELNDLAMLSKAKGCKGSVTIRGWDAQAWYDGGIMHMKLWIADQKHVYVGSANMDWLSLSQVKEMGIVVYNSSSTVAAAAQDYFDSFFSFAEQWGGGGGGLAPSDAGMAISRFDPDLGTMSKVPCWEAALTARAEGTCEDKLEPSPKAGSVPRWQNPEYIDPTYDPESSGSSSKQGSKQGSDGGSGGSYFLSASPVALVGDCGGSRPADLGVGFVGQGSRVPTSTVKGEEAEVKGEEKGEAKSQGQLKYGERLADCARTWDEDALVLTILDARESLSLSVMDLLPTNAYSVNTSCSNFGGGGGGPGSINWSRLLDAVATAVYANGVKARLLISHWAHSTDDEYRYLQAFAATGAVTAARILANEASPWVRVDPSSAEAWHGSLEIGIFEVPGWGNTESYSNYTKADYNTRLPRFPPYSRVNHAKYLVTDRRVNIGTSNYQPSYFYKTAGTSFNSDEGLLVSALQAAFDRDWASDYTTPLANFTF